MRIFLISQIVIAINTNSFLYFKKKNKWKCDLLQDERTLRDFSIEIRMKTSWMDSWVRWATEMGNLGWRNEFRRKLKGLGHNAHMIKCPQLKILGFNT